VAVFVFGIEIGILIGIAVSIGLFLWHASRPHVAIVGRVPGTEHFRNFRRHEVNLSKSVATVRIDESLFFANAVWLENWVLAFAADHPEAEHFVLICAAINFIDGSALETLERLDEQLESAGVTLHLAEVKGPVMDRLQTIGFADRLGAERFHLSPHAAMTALEDKS
ncbi:MAG: sodium-independent anion transporter, partial [Rhodospirillales bacterium]|nr:sodium-independent anion transporter [Rhodospirillales bacterium]